jgi:hypothetical protein
MIPTAQTEERYRLVVSDGSHYIQSMLATKANHVVHDGKLVRGCIARIREFTPNNVRGKKYVMRREACYAGLELTKATVSLSFTTSKSLNPWVFTKRLASPPAWKGVRSNRPPTRPSPVTTFMA